MGIMQQSSKAQDRTLGIWYQHIKQGQIKLPRFQRFEAWDRGRITSFMNTIINNLPVGVTLALEVGSKEKFISRYIVTSEPATIGTVNQHLLDGQQRLTAFWRSMHNNYESETFFVYLPDFDKREARYSDEVEVYCLGRWHDKDGRKMPLWADDPVSSLYRGFVPISLLCPDDLANQVDKWVNESTSNLEPNDDEPNALAKYKLYTATKEKLKDEINSLRERVTHFNLPYLSLPIETPKDVALQVFINMNTNSKPLSLYDIIVAEVESVAGKSLHDLEKQLVGQCPRAIRFGDIRNLILSTSALLQDKTPNNKGMIEMDKEVLLVNWAKLESGLEKMAWLLDSQGVFDAARLPTNAVLAVIAALYDLIPEHGDFVAKAEKLLRAYLWSAFFTNRYENSAASRAFADYKGLKAILSKQDFSNADWNVVPIFNRDEYPLSNTDSLAEAGWPRSVGIEARGVLAVGSYFGAYDFADNRKATFESIEHREYHHLFPDALLKEIELNSFYAMNCALITWKTNRVIGRKDPIEYLKERVELSDMDSVQTRLRTHLIPYDLLAKAHYSNMGDEELKSKLNSDFIEFRRSRAKLFEIALNKLCVGEQPTLDAIWNEYQGSERSLDDVANRQICT